MTIPVVSMFLCDFGMFSIKERSIQRMSLLVVLITTDLFDDLT